MRKLINTDICSQLASMKQNNEKGGMVMKRQKLNATEAPYEEALRKAWVACKEAQVKLKLAGLECMAAEFALEMATAKLQRASWNLATPTS